MTFKILYEIKKNFNPEQTNQVSHETAQLKKKSIKRIIKSKLKKYFLILTIFLNFFSVFTPTIILFSILETISYSYWVILLHLLIFIIYTLCNLFKYSDKFSLLVDVFWFVSSFTCIIVELIIYGSKGDFMIYKQNVNLFIILNGLYLIIGVSL
ncbi:hypothetical protein TUBRATIS_21110 [Tubulinosema ratisbonensis]|uniref:Uncharacterized protein n=1 Tax=Tubulinosema ratisbonensis TaxID=291195 RepID=A0A437AJT5_9MICR|nr:hypothetical protein TUBRATIS_21110 [Tubulinosema ratisbonensis]